MTHDDRPDNVGGPDRSVADTSTSTSDPPPSSGTVTSGPEPATGEPPTGTPAAADRVAADDPPRDQAPDDGPAEDTPATGDPSGDGPSRDQVAGDGPADDGAAGPDSPPGGESPGTLWGWSGWRHEVLLALEVVALCALGFARPVLDSFGRSPETFVARGAGTSTIVAFALVVALGPPLAVSAVALATRAVGPRSRWVAHLAVTGLVGAIALRRLVRDLAEGWAPAVVIGLGVVGGAALVALRWRLVAFRSFLRFAGAASAVYVAQFLALSPTAELVVGDRVTGVDAEVAAGVSAGLGDDPPDVVMLVFDALPLQTLLDGRGRVDADLYPNFAALAGTSSWYRNNTTVSMYTRDAVPAILTGRYPDPANAPDDVPSADPENLFTLLGGTYDLHVREQITRLCPDDLCPAPADEGLRPLLGDAVSLWREGEDDGGGDGTMSLPALLDDDRFGEAESWIAEHGPRPGADNPGLFFYHAALPHDPWQFLPDGTVYDTGRFPPGYHQVGWYGPGIEVGRRRHVLQAQAADTLLGRMLDRMREAGTFDDSLVVVTADHGHSFIPGPPWRWLDRDNYEQLMWTPLFIKAPGQGDPEVVDDNVMSIDIVPTIAESLGVELPWNVDGRPVGAAGERDQDLKYVDDDEDNYWRAPHGETVVEVDDTLSTFERVLEADPVGGEGPESVWRPTPHGDLVGQQVGDLDVGDAVIAAGSGRAGGSGGSGGGDNAGDPGGSGSGGGDAPAGGPIVVDRLDRLEDVDVDGELPLEAVGRGDLEVGSYVAYALNGTVATVAEVEADERSDVPMVLGLLRPDLFTGGANELTAYLIEGDPGSETLHPVDVY